MLDSYQTDNILFLDIETAPQFGDFSEIPETFGKLWEKKAGQLAQYDRARDKETQTPGEMYERAGIYAEFGKIICISTGIFRNGTLWIKSFSGDDEPELLTAFIQMLLKAKEKNRLEIY